MNTGGIVAYYHVLVRYYLYRLTRYMRVHIEQCKHRLAVTHRHVKHTEQRVNHILSALKLQRLYLIVVVVYALVMQKLLLLFMRPALKVIRFFLSTQVAQVLSIVIKLVGHIALLVSMLKGSWWLMQNHVIGRWVLVQ